MLSNISKKEEKLLKIVVESTDCSLISDSVFSRTI